MRMPDPGLLGRGLMWHKNRSLTIQHKKGGVNDERDSLQPSGDAAWRGRRDALSDLRRDHQAGEEAGEEAGEGREENG